MKASKQQDAAITTEAAVESEAVVTGEESTVMEQAAAVSGTEIAEELVAAAEAVVEDQPHGETVQEAAAAPDPTDFAEMYRARLIESAIQNAQRMAEYGAYLSQHVPSATEGIGQLVGLYQDAARKCVAEWR